MDRESGFTIRKDLKIITILRECVSRFLCISLNLATKRINKIDFYNIYTKIEYNKSTTGFSIDSL